jgi:hypothetical protein
MTQQNNWGSVLPKAFLRRKQPKYTLRDLGLLWFLRNTWGLNWLWQIIDAWHGARYHRGTEFTFWFYLKRNFQNRWPYS